MNATSSLEIDGGLARSAAIPRSRLLRTYVAEAKYESLRMLRAPGFAIPFLGLPVGLYLLFAVLIAGAATRSDPGVARFFFSGFTVFGVIGPAMFGFGVIVATEREQGLLKLKRALPMPPAAYLLAKAFMAMLFAAIIMATMLAAGLTLGHLTLTAGQALNAVAIGLLGSLPFCALGLLIGVWTTSRTSPAIVNLIYLPMLHLSGLFYPLPKVLQAMAPVWPAYHLSQLMHGAIGLDSRGATLTHVAVLALVTVALGALALRRLARNG
jgi:ABC-2 type transport system permease protein